MERDPDQPSFSAGRRFGIGFNVVVASALFLLVVVMANYLAARHYRRFVLSPETAPALSPETLGVLRNLTNTVRIVTLFDSEEPLYRHVRAMLREYQNANPKLTLEHVDYVRDPAAAQAIKAQYNLAHLTDKDLVLFDCNKKVKVVYDREMSDYDYSGLVAGRTNEVKRVAFKGESLFSAAIVSVTDPRTLVACYLMGHGEQNPREDKDQFGYAKFIALLNEKNIRVEALSLLGTNEVPPACQLLVIAGPQERIEPPELEKIDKYLTAGGRLLLLVNSLAPNTGLERVIANWGVTIGNNRVFDPQRTTMKQDLMTMQMANHPIVRPLAAFPLHVMMPRTVERAAGGASTADAAKVVELVMTGPDAFAVTDIRNGVPYPNPADRKGPLSLAVAVEKGGLEGVRGATRMVIVGESLFLGNNLLESGCNRDFASLSVNWMLDRSALMGGVGPRVLKAYKLNLTREQMHTLHWLLLAVLPCAVLLLGWLVWLRRRR
ncbi:MAG: Gldg family protein [Verrucomicrobia bacterium]|nr:Gldg family protein [Verrucomicrobiota bacterium]